MNRTTLYTIACLIVLSACSSFLVSCSDKPAEKPLIRPVRYQRVTQQGAYRSRTYSGITQSAIESKLSFRVPGTIQELAVKLGDRVRAGQLIARLDPTDYELKEQQAQAALERAQAQARNAKANYERIRSLYENNNVSLTELDSARAQFESTKAAVESSQKELELARLQIEYTSLHAPIDGAISLVDVEVNENVTAGAQIVLLSSESKIEVKVLVPEFVISKIFEGRHVTVQFNALPGKTFYATIKEVGVSANGISTTFPVTVSLDNPPPQIRPGMTAEVTFQFATSTRKNCFIVPLVAVGADSAGRFVFILEKTGDELGTVHRRNVSVGDITEDGIEVNEGLSDGDLIVTAGINNILDGMTVKILDVWEKKD